MKIIKIPLRNETRQLLPGDLIIPNPKHNKICNLWFVTSRIDKEYMYLTIDTNSNHGHFDIDVYILDSDDLRSDDYVLIRVIE